MSWERERIRLDDDHGLGDCSEGHGGKRKGSWRKEVERCNANLCEETTAKAMMFKDLDVPNKGGE